MSCLFTLASEPKFGPRRYGRLGVSPRAHGCACLARPPRPACRKQCPLVECLKPLGALQVNTANSLRIKATFSFQNHKQKLQTTFSKSRGAGLPQRALYLLFVTSPACPQPRPSPAPGRRYPSSRGCEAADRAPAGIAAQLPGRTGPPCRAGASSPAATHRGPPPPSGDATP